MNGRTRIVKDSFWDDDYVRDLNTEGKCLYVYLMCNRKHSVSGLYEISIRTMAEETGIPKDSITDYLHQLEDDGKIRYDWDRHELFLLNALAHHWNKAETHQTRTKRDLCEIKNPDFKRQWFVIARSTPTVGELLFTEADVGLPPEEQKKAEKKTKAKAGENGKSAAPAQEKTRFLEFLLLTPDEHTKLVEKFGADKAASFMEQLNSAIGQMGTAKAAKYFSNHYYTILNWQRKGKFTEPAGGDGRESTADRLSRLAGL